MIHAVFEMKDSRLVGTVEYLVWFVRCHPAGKALTSDWSVNNYRPQRSCEGNVFTGVCLSTGGGVPGPGGSSLGRCLVPWGLLPGSSWSQGVGGLLPGGIRACTEEDTPRERSLLLQTVRILLECILVLGWLSLRRFIKFSHNVLSKG